MTEWEYEGKFCVTEGLINLWWNPKTCDDANFGADPPVLREAVTTWLAEHPDVRYLPEPMVGPPIFEFPSVELRDEFKERFLETAERMREIIDAGIAKKDLRDALAWYEQGKPIAGEDGFAYIYSEEHGCNVLIRNPEKREDA